jgi:hypothetical protein
MARNFTGDHVDLIAVGQRNDHIGIGNTGSLKYIRMSRMTDDGSDIQSIL